MTRRVQTGLDVFQGWRKRRGKRLGLIVHQASVTRALEPAVPALERKGFKIAALFAPEHGLAGTLQDQVHVGTEKKPGTPVHSLYGEKRAPSPETLKNLDALVFDLQDIGVRYYTFIWTMALAMEAAAKAKVPFVVLDRPNPLGGEAVEGDILDPAFASFVGLHPIPVRHGMTCGELALYLNALCGWNCDLTVVPARGWRRRQWFDETGLPWVLPSPNMPTLDTAAVYAGMCLLEATNLSEGRGTTRPFELAGAPFIRPEVLAAELAAQKLPGVRFRPCSFLPTFNKWAGRTCHGVQLHVTDRRAFRPYLTGLSFLQTVRRLHPRDFQWKPPPYEFEAVKLPMDILCGGESCRRAVETGADLAALARSWEKPLRDFRRRTRPFLLYPNSPVGSRAST
jgi:uncharacterized protein YbbC (DUF1343 family)